MPAAFLVDLEPKGALAPAACACCGALPSGSRLETRRDGGSLIVPYCGDCLRHASFERTRGLAALLSAALAASSFAVALPLWASFDAALVVAITLAAGAAPLAIAALWPARRQGPHSAARRAAWWRTDGRLCCTSEDFARELGRANGFRVTDAQASERRLPLWSLGGLLPALLLWPSLAFARPSVRIVNLGETRIEVFFDGRRLSVVEPAATEAPDAAMVAQLAPGRHRLTATGPEGVLLDSREVEVQGGAEHLYAPHSAGFCFWTETASYGRDDEPARLEPLDPTLRFWAIEASVDRWFVANPPPGSDRRSSGGSLTAVRFSDCREAPAVVRRVAKTVR